MLQRIKSGWLFAIGAGLLISSAPESAAAYPLIGGLGGAEGYGMDFLPANDDLSTAEIDVRLAFPQGLRFFGQTFTSLFVNNNGNITFGGALPSYTPQPFPIASQRMIAPWWGDVDTRGAGFPMGNSVWWSIKETRFVATWHNVGYFNQHDDLKNDFQLVINDQSAISPGDFDVQFRYNRCEWTTGDASGGSRGFGGTPAQAGFDAGDLTHFVALPGSLTMAILDVCRTSNVNIPGLWEFQIRGGEVSVCGNRQLERGEQCDDGNRMGGDGCSSNCQIERDSGVPPEAGVDAATFVDGRVIDGRVIIPNEGGLPACGNWNCDPQTSLEGRAGPIGGCTCSTTGPLDASPSHLATMIAVLAMASGVSSRRTRRSRQG